MADDAQPCHVQEASVETLKIRADARIMDVFTACVLLLLVTGFWIRPPELLTVVCLLGAFSVALVFVLDSRSAVLTVSEDHVVLTTWFRQARIAWRDLRRIAVDRSATGVRLYSDAARFTVSGIVFPTLKIRAVILYIICATKWFAPDAVVQGLAAAATLRCICGFDLRSDPRVRCPQCNRDLLEVLRPFLVGNEREANPE